MARRAVLIVATMDTKGNEARYVEALLRERGLEVLIIDAGIRGESPFPVAVKREDVARAGGMDLSGVRALGHEGEALAVMVRGAVEWARRFYREGRIAGILGLGGSMGTTLGTAVMRSFPIGFPKVMISTMASRDTRSFVGTKDIAMIHSVCDLSGINRITQRVLRNGALAVAGMALGAGQDGAARKPLIVLSTLGTTEACVQSVKPALERQGFEVVVFHTVGSGGEAMEAMIEEEETEAVVDLSLHEIADHLFGGDYNAGPERGLSALKKGVPTLLVPGNIDFLVSGPMEEAKRRFPGRLYHAHNAAITVMRTRPDEMVLLARRIAALANSAGGPVTILLPMGGFSAFDSPGAPFWDPEGRSRFREALEGELLPSVTLSVSPLHVNDPTFSELLLASLQTLLGR